MLSLEEKNEKKLITLYVLIMVGSVPRGTEVMSRSRSPGDYVVTQRAPSNMTADVGRGIFSLSGPPETC